VVVGFSTDPGNERFEIRRRIGGGSMGEVFEAFDRQRGELVALKTLRHPNASSLYNFKKEFRTLAHVSHPNLVSLYELIIEDDQSFFTMELVEGESLKDYAYPSQTVTTLDLPPANRHEVATPGLVDGTRLRSALLQLASGVKAVHDAGKLHRDLKPSNLLITPRGRLVVLDFGVATELNPTMRSIDTGIAGTAAYMAPEQARGEPTQPASDWYAVGVILFEVLTGRWPFTGSLARILIDKQFLAAPSPAELVAEVPADLLDLCRSLLEIDPAARPTGSEVVRRLGGTETAELLVKGPGNTESSLVGRRAHLASLEEAFALSQEGRPVSVYIHGSSGIGKTTLVDAFVQRARTQDQAILLTGRCYQHESVPYKALDGVVDSLSRQLRRFSNSQVDKLLPPQIGLLVRLFPVLLRVEAVAAAIESQPAEDRRQSGARDLSTLRRQALKVLRLLLTRLAMMHPVIVHVDDLQWADVASAILLRDLSEEEDAPPILFLSSFRSEEVDAQSFLQDLLAHTDSETCRQLAVEGLSDTESEDLVKTSLGLQCTSEPLIRAITEEANGSPFLLKHLSRHALACGSRMGTGIRVREMLDLQLQQVSKNATSVMNVLAIASKPIDWRFACRVARVAKDQRRLEATLKVACLVRGSNSDNLVEIYHDRIREALLEGLDAEDAQDLHGRFAATLEEQGCDDPETLMEHYARAGDEGKAARQARQAAQRAATALAFERAAQLYRRALDLGRPEGAERVDLLHGLAESLALAGRPQMAAELHLELAETTAGRVSLDYRRCAAMEYLMAGYVDKGLALARGVLREVGLEMASSRWSCLTSLYWHRFHLWLRRYGYRAREAARIPARRLLRIDTCWAIAAGLEMADTLRAADFQARHLLLALEAGEERRIARALAMEVAFSAETGSRQRHQAAKLRQRAHRLAAEIGDTYAASLATLQDGVAVYLEGDWQGAVEICSRAETMFHEGNESAVWEITTARRFALSSLAAMGQLAEVSRRLPRFLREAREHGNIYGTNELRTRLHIFWLAKDDPDEARRQLDEAGRSWTHEGFHLPHWNLVAARVQTDLYTGHGVDALATIEQHWPTLQGAFLLKIQIVRAEAILLRARSALAAALQERSRGAELQTQALRLARRLERERLPFAQPQATLIRAAVAILRGDEASALADLERAAFGFEACAMHLHSAVAWRRVGELMGGAAGKELSHRSDAWMSGEKIRNPSHMTAMVAPGFRS
jgi:serine/threonine protein kinase